jgi:RND superfamily putative drug exporter
MMDGSQSKKKQTGPVPNGDGTRGSAGGHDPGFTGRITRAAALHPWRALGVWLLLVFAAFGASGAMNVSSDTATAGTEATTASDLIKERLREQTPPEEFIIVESETTTTDEAAFAGFVDSLVGDLRALSEVDSVVSYRDGSEGLVSENRHSALVTARLAGDEEDAADSAKPLVGVVQKADGTDGFRVTTVGFGSVEGEISSLMEDTLKQGEMIGIAVALVILLVVFGAAVAAGLPILVALLAIFVAVGATALVSNAMEMSDFVVFIITMIGLAVGIDYSLFIVQRFREERASGRQKIEAITTAGATASRAVFFSGMAVVIALAGMLITPDPVFQSFAVGAMLVVAVTVLAALTLLPAVLALLGDRVNWLTLPFIGRRTGLEGTGGLWGIITKLVTARPVLSVVLSGGLLVAAALPVFNINLGTVGIGTLPEDSNQRHAFDVLNQEFSDGVLTADVVIDAPDLNAPAVQGGIEQLITALNEDGFFGTSKIEKNGSGDLALLTVAMPGDFSSPESKSALDRLRGDYIPAAFSDGTAEIFVGGPTAETVDSVQTQRDYLPFVFTFVLGLSFLLLLMVFRSIVVPLKAVAMNMLSVGAAYGVLVLVFQEGVGTGLLGFQKSPVIESWLPLFLFAILFGLSMDYHVFLLSRIKERYDETGDNTASVRHGLRQTASIITGAALIMVAVFGGMASGDLVIFQQVGFGLAVAIILDATIIRMVLVPASMELLGDWNWYLPHWLEWLPDVHVESRPEPATQFLPATIEHAIGGGE